jgi:prepilin peptidase CpaA
MFSDPHSESAVADLAFDALLPDLIVLIFAGLCVAAAAIDLRRFIIPDSIVVGLLGLWPIWIAVSGHGQVGFILLGAVAMFAAGVVLFAFGVMGGGDVKLMTVLALWAEPAGLPAFLFYTSLAGGFLSIYWLLPLRRLVAPVIGWTEGLRDNKQIPYGVAIAVGGLAIAQRLWGI